MAFGSLRAVDDVTLQVASGEVVGLVGTNGAGKSTLVNAIAGVLPVASGTIRLAGDAVYKVAAWRRTRLGVARTFQNLELFESMTVLENVLCGRDWMTSWSLRSRQSSHAAALQALRDLGLTPLAHRTVAELSYPDRKLVEFARVLAMDARLLLLDEPTAGVAIEERGAVVDVLKRMLTARPHMSVVVVEHDISVIAALCGIVHVMASGRVIFSGAFHEMLTDPVVKERYLGNESYSDSVVQVTVGSPNPADSSPGTRAVTVENGDHGK